MTAVTTLNRKFKICTTPYREKQINKKKCGEKEKLLTETLANSKNDKDIYSYIFPEETKTFTDRKNPAEKPVIKKNDILNNPLLPLCLTPIITFGTLAIVTGLFKKNLAVNKALQEKSLKGLPPTSRLISMNDDNDMVLFLATQNPNIKTYMGAIGVLGASAFTFVSKNFIDGCKEIWENKQFAKIKKNQQEELIEIEGNSFKGRYNRLYSLLHQTEEDLKQIDLKNSHKIRKKMANLFGNLGFKYNNHNLGFGAEKKTGSTDNKETKNHKINLQNINTILLGAGVLGTTMGLGYLSLKNVLGITGKSIKTKANFIKEQIKKESLKNKEVFGWPPEMYGDARKTAFTSCVQDKTAFLYTYLISMGTEAEQLAKNLFLMISSIGSISYIGKSVVEAIKNVKVKEENTRTDTEMHRELISTEIKNFETKKRKFIEPLKKGYEKFLETNPANEEKTGMKQRILDKIESGPPYIWD